MHPHLDVTAARAAAQAGASLAVTHADSVWPNWSARATAELIAYAMAAAPHAFMLEDVRMALPAEFPRPPDERAWGLVVRAAKQRRWIRHAGYAPQAAVTCHGSPKSLWVWAGVTP